LKIYAVNNGAKGNSKPILLRFRTPPNPRPIITGPKQLTAISGQNLGFTITADRPCSTWSFSLLDFEENGVSRDGATQALAAFSWPASRLGLPGVSTYAVGGLSGNQGWGVLSGLPLRIDPATGAPAITSADYLIARLASTVSPAMTASGSPTEFAADFSGNAPSGISLDRATGQFTGTPKVPGSYSFLARARNAQGWSLPKFTTLAVLPAATQAAARNPGPAGLRGFSLDRSGSPVVYQAGQSMTYTPTVSGSPNFFIFSDLPPGLAGNTTTGQISGIPENPGYFDVWVRPFSDSAVGEKIELLFHILPIAGTPVITPGLVINGTAGTALSHTLAATPAPAGFNLTNLPDFVIVDPLTGIVSGTPDTPGTYNFQASAFNALGGGMPVTVTLQIAPAAGTPVVALQQPLPTLQVGVPFSATLTSAPAAAFYDSGSLPYGINLNPQTGIISGTPLEPGRQAAPVWGVNQSGQGGSLPLLFDIAGATGTPIILNPPVVRVVARKAFTLQFSSSPPATSYSISPVPPGLAWNPLTGLLSGTLAASATVIVSASNALGQGSIKAIELKVFNSPSTLWLDEEFGSDATDPSIAGWNAAPAGDGVSNFLKYAFGIKPWVSAAHMLPQGTIERIGSDDYLALTVKKNPNATDVLLVPEITSDLEGGPWNSGSGYLTPLEETPAQIKVRDRTPMTGNLRRFIRIRAYLLLP
jgi:hypothetical protein